MALAKFPPEIVSIVDRNSKVLSLTIVAGAIRPLSLPAMSAEIVCNTALGLIIRKFEDQILESNEKFPFVIGIGSGSTIVPFVKQLTEYIISQEVKPYVVCIPTSEQARRLLLDNLKSKSFRLGTLDEFIKIDVTVDGADAVFFNEKFLVKGGGAAHCQEKIIAEASNYYIIVVADNKKLDKSFESVSIPVEILPLALNSLIQMFKKEFGNELISCNIRNCPSGSGKIGPIITDNGNMILDLKFSEKLSKDPKDLDLRLRQHAGVIETGIFWRIPKETLIIYPTAEGNQAVCKLKYLFK